MAGSRDVSRRKQHEAAVGAWVMRFVVIKACGAIRGAHDAVHRGERLRRTGMGEVAEQRCGVGEVEAWPVRAVGSSVAPTARR